MLVKIKREHEAGKSVKGYYLNNLENSIAEFIDLYNISEYQDRIIDFDDKYVTFDILDENKALHILDNIDSYKVNFICIAKLDTDEISEDTLLIEKITHLQIRKAEKILWSYWNSCLAES